MDAQGRPSVTILKTAYKPLRQEAIAGAAVMPGMLVDFQADGELQPHAVADGPAAPRFAVEAEQIGNGINVPYVAGETAQYILAAGMVFYALLDTGQNVLKGAPLSSSGDGSLKAVRAAAAGPPAVDGGYVVAYAAENVDNSAGVTHARIRVEVA